MREDCATSTKGILTDVFSFLLSNILGKGNADEFDRLFLEVNCDSGRVLAAATTHERRENGRIDGCSVRFQEIQDYWYDLVEAGASDKELMEGIRNKVGELGQIYREVFTEHLEKLRTNCSKNGFKYIVYGSDPGVVYLEENFEP